jgi:hypothetical protein
VEFKSARLALAGLLLLTGIATACSEDLDNSAGCPILCPSQGGSIETVTIDAVTLDSTVSALTGQGTEPDLFIATRGDTLDSRAVIRFDSLPSTFVRPGTDTTSIEITTVDSAVLRLRVDTIGMKVPASFTLDFYDVNSSAPDSLVAPLVALFTPDRLIASATLLRDSVIAKDTVKVSIPASAILQRKGGPMRLGIRARGPQSVQLKLFSEDGANTPTVLSFRVSPDTTVAKIQLLPFSKTPADNPVFAGALADYTLLVRGTATGSPELLNIGGLPSRRVYMRFNIPPRLLDSVDVIRATLLLNQIPNTQIDPTDTVRILPQVSLAGTAVSDIAKAAQITTPASTDTLKVTPGGSGLKLVEIANVMALWRVQLASDTPRALVLVSTQEGSSPLEARFYGNQAAAALRPQLRISYSTRRATGLP